MVEIHDKQEVLLSGDAAVFRHKLCTVLGCMREELDDHRLAINENTAEIESTNEFLNELNRKIDKLGERVDELTLIVKGENSARQFDLQPLTAKEKDVFHALYVLTETQPFASYEQIARKALMSKEVVVNYITAIVNKGVPVLKKIDGRKVFFRLDPVFREKQAKHNIVGINSLLTCWVR